MSPKLYTQNHGDCNPNPGYRTQRLTSNAALLFFIPGAH